MNRLCLALGLVAASFTAASFAQAASVSAEGIPAGCHYQFGYCVAPDYQSVFNVDAAITPRPTADLQAVLRLGAQVTMTRSDQVAPTPLAGFSEFKTNDGVLFVKRTCRPARGNETRDSCAYLTAFVAQRDLSAARASAAAYASNITLWASSPAAMKAVQEAIAAIAGAEMVPLSDLSPAEEPARER